MISIRKKFLFIHVPKTAGNSLQNILRDYSEDEIVTLANHQDGVERFEVRSRQYDITKHSTLDHYKSVIDPDIYKSLFKFATIRNPWDMMVSFYFSPHRGVTEWNRDDFLSLVYATPTLRHYVAETTMIDTLLDRVGMNKPVLKSPLGAHIDYLIRFENLGEDFDRVCEKLDIPKVELPKRNSSVRTHYSKYYDDELKEIVRSRFAEDIAYGGYDFEYGE